MKLCFLLLSIFFLSSCACGPACTTPLHCLQDMSAPVISDKAREQNTNRFRAQAIQDSALSAGAQAGLAYRAQEINGDLTKQDKYLSKAFNFYLLMLPHNVLPPVLLQGDNDLRVADCTSIRLADRIYKIKRQACFVSAPPIWRDYLWMNYEAPDAPPSFILPRNLQERMVWKHYVTKGWNEGVAQADAIFSENLARLKEDYSGMILYLQLLHQGMVSAPYVGKMDLGITGDENNLRIHDQVLRITALPELNPNAKDWHPAVAPGPLPCGPCAGQKSSDPEQY